MKVEITEMVYLGGRRIRPGEVIDIPDDTPKSSWFTSADKPKAEPLKVKGKAQKAAPDTLSGIAKAKAEGPTDIA